MAHLNTLYPLGQNLSEIVVPWTNSVCTGQIPWGLENEDKLSQWSNAIKNLQYKASYKYGEVINNL